VEKWNLFVTVYINNQLLSVPGFVTQPSGRGKAVDKSPSDGMAAEHRPVGIRTEPSRQRCAWCSHGMYSVLIVTAR